MCGQGMRIQAKKSKLKDDIKISVGHVPKRPHQCSTPHCHTQDPTSGILCDECITRKYPSTSNMYEDEQQTNSSISSYSSILSSPDSQPIKTKRAEWRCNICEYTENTMHDEICVVCEIGQRSEQLKPYEQGIGIDYQSTGQGNDIVISED